MLEQISPLWDAYLENKHQGSPLVLATLVTTIGSSYKKAGAMMLIEQDRTSHGLISGGCLEADVAEHAITVFETGLAITLEYDLSDESIFGLGAGCDGRIKIVLQVIDGDYLPFSALEPLPQLAENVKLLINSDATTAFPIGSYYVRKGGKMIESAVGFYAANQQQIDVLKYMPPPKIAICGAGIDVSPLIEILHLLQWHVYLIDHRPGRLQSNSHHLSQIIEVKMTELSATLQSHQFDAVAIMTHNLDRDAAYLKHFSAADVPWLGLLGPFKRRDKVLQKAGLQLDPISTRLHAPIGLDLGGQMPENIAVSIAAQLQQYFYQS
ncbi:Xanthine and CO dehydrogenases maturation factor, XdhC/CoxF family [hydrothermal vent metagenome]|uniref:Xanthine and CO dehydrogenases maturation factor, XdhC/CoxF family n=1 Tax=hydrothermal vent metagenome TaxID=652676 RepID=A0A3B0VZ87_9ZZZZ